MKLYLLGLAVLLGAGLICRSQSTGETVTLRGTVLDAVQKVPVAGAAVQLKVINKAGKGRVEGTISTATGEFEFPNVQPGAYRLLGSRTGYMKGEFGAKAPGQIGTPVRVQASSSEQQFGVMLWPTAAVSGSVRTDDGQPVSGAEVEVLRRGYQYGLQSWTSIGSATSDDRGRYRVGLLPAGKFLICAMPHPQSDQEDAPVTFLPACYPGSPDPAGASRVELQSGNEIDGMDVLLNRTKRVPLAGKIMGSPHSLSVWLTPAQWTFTSAAVRRSVSRANGSFSFADAAEGNYQLTLVDASTGSVTVPVTVDRQSTEPLQLQYEPARSMRCHVVSGDATKLSSSRLVVSLDPVDPNFLGMLPGVSPVEPGTFLVSRLSSGRYALVIRGLAPNQYVKEVSLGGQHTPSSLVNISDAAPAEMTVTIRGDAGEISGTVRDADHNPAPGAFVGLLSEDGVSTLPQSAEADENGAFVFHGLKPGTYKAVALPDSADGAWQSAEAGRIVGSYFATIQVSPKDSQSAELQIVPSSVAAALM